VLVCLCAYSVSEVLLVQGLGQLRCDRWSSRQLMEYDWVLGKASLIFADALVVPDEAS